MRPKARSTPSHAKFFQLAPLMLITSKAKNAITILFNTARAVTALVIAIFDVRKPAPADACVWLVRVVGPSDDAKMGLVPSRLTAMLAFVSLLACFAIGGCVVRYPGSPSPYVAIGMMFSLAALLSSLLVVDIIRFIRCEHETRASIACLLTLAVRGSPNEKYQYRRNLGNSVCTVIVSLVVLPSLFYVYWQPAMNRTVIKLSEDTVVSFAAWI